MPYALNKTTAKHWFLLAPSLSQR